MNALISTTTRRLGWSSLALVLAIAASLWLTWRGNPATLTDGDMMKRFLILPALLSFFVLILLTACANVPIEAPASATAPSEPPAPFMAQVVGVQWLNPLQRRDYPTEWQLLWTLGLVRPNKDDDMLRANPKRFSTLQSIGMIASGSRGKETFNGYHHKYVSALITPFFNNYFSSSYYFYNAHSLKDKTTWRELAGIHVEYALPEGRLDPVEAANFTREFITDTFSIGNINFPKSWTRSTPPDVRVTMGGANAGFVSLAAGLDYLQSHPKETVWVMNWDAPNFPPKDEQINENMVLLVLAGPLYHTGRAPLAWLGYPATSKQADFDALPSVPRIVQAWQATLAAAARHAGKQTGDIVYVIHDAGNTYPASSERIGPLAQSLTLELAEFDFNQQTFNTPALLGEMGAGSALTNVALGIAYANHFGKPVLAAGTSDSAAATAVLVAPPATVRPIDPEQPWFRARGGNNAFLMWWGLRQDTPADTQGYSK